MGKASRRKTSSQPGGAAASGRVRAEQVPYVARPFEGLASETEWVALREILPSATAVIRFAPGRAPEGAPAEATVATVLPLAWPGLHRADGTVFIGTQAGSATGDASRDLAQSLLTAAAAEPGSPVATVGPATLDTPRLQDLLEDAPLEVEVHEGFDFWVGESELDAEAKESLERANASVVPTVKMAAMTSAYWCRIGERTHIRLVLPDDEDLATEALARLHAAGESSLGDPTRLLGAFRASGLLVPVWDLDPQREPADYEDGLAAWSGRYAAALARTEPLTPEERRSRNGLLSRQVTLR